MAFKLGTARAAVGLSEARSQDWPPLSNVRLEIWQAQSRWPSDSEQKAAQLQT